MTDGALFEPPPDASRLSVPEGEVILWRPAAHVVVQVHHGEYNLALAEKVVTFYDSLWTSVTTLQIFKDFEQLSTYTRETREYLSQYVRAHVELIGAYHVLTTSEFVLLGMSVFGLATGARVHSYADRTSFAQALMRALAPPPSSP
jgi:hypothetical protein